jgi:hypothetical protein
LRIFQGTQRSPHHMHDAKLHLGPGRDRLDGFRKSFQPIHAGDQDVLHPTVLQLRQHPQPELRSFDLRHPQPPALPSARPGSHPAPRRWLCSGRGPHRVPSPSARPDTRSDTALPAASADSATASLPHHGIRHVGNQRRGNFDPVDFFQVALNLPRNATSARSGVPKSRSGASATARARRKAPSGEHDVRHVSPLRRSMLGLARIVAGQSTHGRWLPSHQTPQSDGSPRIPESDHSFDRFVSTYVFDLLAPGFIDRLLSEAHRLSAICEGISGKLISERR